jgi:hypothetical protein
MKREIKIILLPLLLVLMVSNLSAKWWIFGQNEDSVTVNYLYVNSLSFDETDKELLFSTETLKDGFVHIQGRANAGSSSIGKVLVTTDNKKNWQATKLAADGSFDFSFEADVTKKYDVFVKIIDTTGKTNEVDETYKIIRVTNEDMTQLVMKTLDKLKDAYESEMYAEFMKYVKDDFTGDYVALELALKQDFNLFNNIQINFTINSLAYQNGKYLVTVTYNRTLESTRDSNVYSDSGITEFNFKDGKFGAMLFSMKNPILFGLSDAEDISNGASVISTQNDAVITVNETGKVEVKTITQIANGDDLSSGGLVSLAATGGSSSGFLEYEGFIFSSESTVSFGIGDINPLGEPFFDVGNGACIQYVTDTGTINNVTSLPSDGGLTCAGGTPALIGHILEVKLANGNYVIFQLKGMNASSITIEWKYF